MEKKGLIKICILLFAGLFSLSVNAATLTGDVVGSYLGNDNVDTMFDATGDVVTELFRDELPASPEVWTGTVLKDASLANLDYLVVKFDGVFGVYDVSAYTVETVLEWATADFADSCALLVKPNGKPPNCRAAASHITGYSVVPVPAAVWLFASGLLGLVGVARKRV